MYMANQCTFIDGIATSQAIDTAGEIVDLKGMDVSMLEGSVFNYEHESKLPSQIVGKILRVKKIFSEDDCENDREENYWNSIKIPFLYCMGRLFDDKKESAKEVAAMFLDDMEHPNEKPLLGFSVEGSKIDKQGATITRSIARKVTITQCPANKTCLAKVVPSSGSSKDDIDEIFKSDSFVDIELFKFEKSKLKKDGIETADLAPGSPAALLSSEKVNKTESARNKNPNYPRGVNPEYSTPGTPKGVSPAGLAVRHGQKDYAVKEHKRVLGEAKAMKPNLPKSEDMKKAQVPGSKYPSAAQVKPKEQREKSSIPKFGPSFGPAGPTGLKIGATSSGKPVYSHAKVHEYPKFSSKEHGEAADIHRQAAETSQTAADKAHHWDKMKLHGQAAHTAGLRENRLKTAMTNKRAAIAAHAKMGKSSSTLDNPALMPPPMLSMKKALDAGSMMAAPSSLSGGAVLGQENLDKKMKKVSWLKRAEEAYDKWEKKEEFRNWMSKKLPKLSRGEIDAIGATIALSKSVRAEKALSSMAKEDFMHSYMTGTAYKSEDGKSDTKKSDVLMAAAKKGDLKKLFPF